MCYRDPCPCEAADPKRGYYPTMSTEKPIEYFESPESSHVKGAVYNPNTHVLLVTFKERTKTKGGSTPEKTYKYEGFPSNQWEVFKSSSSKGKYVNAILVTSYKGIQVSGMVEQ